MPKHRLFIIVSMLCFIYSIGNSQLEESRFHYGFSAGFVKSKIQDVSTTLIRPIFPTNTYKTFSQDRIGFTAGAFVYYKFKESKFAIQPEINYQDAGGKFRYEDIKELSYNLTFNYAYLQLAPIIKYYLFNGAYLQLGPQLGFIINRSSLRYTSNQPELGPDLQIQQSLREVLKGNNNVSFILGCGYDLPLGLGLSLKYVQGISDTVETLANGFYFIENKNTMSGLSLSVTCAIPFY